jgi:hypothetical protein
MRALLFACLLVGCGGSATSALVDPCARQGRTTLHARTRVRPRRQRPTLLPLRQAKPRSTLGTTARRSSAPTARRSVSITKRTRATATSTPQRAETAGTSSATAAASMGRMTRTIAARADTSAPTRAWKGCVYRERRQVHLVRTSGQGVLADALSLSRRCIA